MFYYTLAIGFVSGFWSREIAKIWIEGSTTYLNRSLFFDRPLFLNFANCLQKGIVGTLAAYTYYTIFWLALRSFPSWNLVLTWLPPILTVISTIHPEIAEMRKER